MKIQDWHSLLSTNKRNRDIMMIREIRSRWREVRESLKARYRVLTDEDLTLYLGHEGELISRLQNKLGKSKVDIIKLIGES